MATSNRARVPTPKQLSSVGVKKDEFETFWHILVTYCQQDSEYLEFFEGGAFDKWQALSVNPTRGVKVEPDPAASDGASAAREANKLSVIKRATLNSLLTKLPSLLIVQRASLKQFLQIRPQLIGLETDSLKFAT